MLPRTGNRKTPLGVAWGAFLLAHAAADVVFALLLLWAHPSFLRELREGYET